MKKKISLFERIMDFLGGFEVEAKKLINDDEKIEKLLKNVENKLKELPKVGDKLSMLPVLVSMVRSYIKGDYRNVSKGTIITIICALIYVISPIDAIADKVPIIGLFDDIFVINLCLSYIQKDVDKYREWRMENGGVN